MPCHQRFGKHAIAVPKKKKRKSLRDYKYKKQVVVNGFRFVIYSDKPIPDKVELG